MVDLPGATADPVTCTGCCLLCDHIEISIGSHGTPSVRNACPVCHEDIIRFLGRSELPTDQSEAIGQAAAILSQAKLPLICGLTDQSIQTQQAAIELARRCNAVIDWTTGNWPFAFQNALQDTGLVSCTYGEIRERADLVIYWSCHPEKTHPSFVERFIRDAPAIHVDWDRRKQTTALRFLRQSGIEPDIDKDSDVAELQSRLDHARYPVIVIDDSLSKLLGETGVLSLFRFVRRQNDRNHCRLVHLSAQQNAAGIQASMTSMTGGPYGITFRHGQPTFRGREFSVESLLTNHRIDALALIGSPRQLPEIEIPGSIPSIWVSDAGINGFSADVTIQTSRWGLDGNGTGIRDDGIPIQRTRKFTSQLPTGAQILTEIGRLL